MAASRMHAPPAVEGGTSCDPPTMVIHAHPHHGRPGHTFEVWYNPQPVAEPAVAAQPEEPTLLEQRAAQQQAAAAEPVVAAKTVSEPATGVPVGEPAAGVPVGEPVVGAVVSTAGPSSSKDDVAVVEGTAVAPDDDKWYPGKYLGQAWDWMSGKDKDKK